MNFQKEICVLKWLHRCAQNDQCGAGAVEHLRCSSCAGEAKRAGDSGCPIGISHTGEGQSKKMYNKGIGRVEEHAFVRL